jgi:glycosyltransferase involved in cell wall biosynthesis
MPRPFFTVAIPFYSHIDHLPITLASIATQTFRNFEVLVVDDASPDGETCRELCETMSSMFPEPIRYIRFDENKKIGVNRQRILDNAKGEYVTMVDSDDLLFSCEVLQIVATNILQQRQQGKIMDVAQMRFLEMHADGGRNVHMPQENAWVHGHFYRMDFLKDNNITFPEYPFYEDGAFNHVVSRLSTQTLYLEDIGYAWVWTNDSITRGQDYLSVMMAYYADSFLRAYKILEPKKGRENVLDLPIAALCQTYYYMQGLERRYPEDDVRIVETYKVLKELVEETKIIDTINADENRFQQFRVTLMNSQLGPMNQDPYVVEHISVNDWLRKHFNVSIKKLELGAQRDFNFTPPPRSMYDDLASKGGH